MAIAFEVRLPCDFKGLPGDIALNLVNWALSFWDQFDQKFLEHWEKWIDPDIQSLDNLTPSMLLEIGKGLQSISSFILDACLDLVARSYDWWGLLESGVPSGYEESAFFWSDMFHYNKTYEFARVLFEKAQDQTLFPDPIVREKATAYAIGWIAHCATDVVGHCFVNMKTGGPYRLHWTRHHLVENHMDAKVYDYLYGQNSIYEELDTSATHLRLVFRTRDDDPYNGDDEAPAYDYFAGLPEYDPADSPSANQYRKELWDLDSNLPEDLCTLLQEAMKQVYYDGKHDKDAPQILRGDSAKFRDGDSGRPSAAAMQDAFWNLFSYIKRSSTHGYSPRKPSEPDLVEDHGPPLPPGGNAFSEDPSRGYDPDDDEITWLDLLLAPFAFALYVGELATWLLTLPAEVLTDILTYPARELIYTYFLEPSWKLYLMSRQPLVMGGFLHPKATEINPGLVELGVSASNYLNQLNADLDSPTGFSSPQSSFDEPTGRGSANALRAQDPAYPRTTVKDSPSLVARYLHLDLPFLPTDPQPSGFIAPWKYPDFNLAGEHNGWELPLVIPGPYQQGQDATVLLGNLPGDNAARHDFEKADNPGQTFEACVKHIPNGRHLGDAVDYSVYLVGQIAAGISVPDFNLDADRGYGYKCWEWDRRQGTTWIPTWLKDIKDERGNLIDFSFEEPCTIPDGFNPDESLAKKPQPKPFQPLAIHYGSEQHSSNCQDVSKVEEQDREVGIAGYRPDGTKTTEPRRSFNNG